MRAGDRARCSERCGLDKENIVVGRAGKSWTKPGMAQADLAFTALLLISATVRAGGREEGISRG